MEACGGNVGEIHWLSSEFIQCSVDGGGRKAEQKEPGTAIISLLNFFQKDDRTTLCYMK